MLFWIVGGILLSCSVRKRAILVGVAAVGIRDGYSFHLSKGDNEITDLVYQLRAQRLYEGMIFTEMDLLKSLMSFFDVTLLFKSLSVVLKK